MKVVKLALLGLAASTFTLPAIAQEYMFTYSKLFSQMKNNVKEGHEDVKVGFFFVDADTKSLCNIEKAWMEKEEHYEELQSSEANELKVPLDNNLRQANPLVFVHTPKDRRCDFSMVVMTKKPLSGKVSYQQIESLLPQMQTMLEDLGGMFASWFTPDVEGITLEFSETITDPVRFSNGNRADVINGKAQIILSEIGEGGYIELPAKTVRVLPYLPAAK
ncbi:DUF2987 domain-containing protein [Vibrio hangzhouensis]|uniref:DUF2987 domain-containing protein n=1 Tax=Vibrio hangzhouensis TaxID=462991 RepID=A0A1H5WEJ2_9VIBR|nr:DUF2987 domain-containing protein [Vibrio hangzhouensis]SEF97894.1 Protein of unknown function [Vibrio hangzhouensis]